MKISCLMEGLRLGGDGCGAVLSFSNAGDHGDIGVVKPRQSGPPRPLAFETAAGKRGACRERRLDDWQFDPEHLADCRADTHSLSFMASAAPVNQGSM
jgi:hypothetical protein